MTVSSGMGQDIEFREVCRFCHSVYDIAFIVRTMVGTGPTLL
jgi:hypothetical protein